MPSTEPIKLPSGTLFSKTIGNNPDYYLLLNAGLQPSIVTLSKEDIIALYEQVIQPVKFDWTNCPCNGRVNYRKKNKKTNPEQKK
jgi:hypothetical protein